MAEVELQKSNIGSQATSGANEVQPKQPRKIYLNCYRRLVDLTPCEDLCPMQTT